MFRAVSGAGRPLCLFLLAVGGGERFGLQQVSDRAAQRGAHLVQVVEADGDGQVVAEQDNVRRADGDVRARAEGQTQLGAGQGRTVLDPSPTMATERPAACRSVITCALAAGSAEQVPGDIALRDAVEEAGYEFAG